MLTDLKNSFTNSEIKLQQDLCHISHRCNKAHVMLSRDERRHIREAGLGVFAMMRYTNPRLL